MQEENIEVIALGTNALRVLETFKIKPDGRTHHPQWYKRFNGKGNQGIIDDLKGVL